MSVAAHRVLIVVSLNNLVEQRWVLCRLEDDIASECYMKKEELV